MSINEKTQKNSTNLIPVIVAIIGLIGAIVVASPSLLGIIEKFFFTENTSQISYVSYEDPSGNFSIEYPSENGILNRENRNDNQMGLTIFPRDSLTSSSDEIPFKRGSKSFGIFVFCGISPYVLSNDDLFVLSEDMSSIYDYKDLVLITNNKIEDGYYVQYEANTSSYGRLYLFMLYKQKDGAYIFVHIIGNGNFEYTRSISEHIISSLTWNPSKVVEYFKNQ